MPTLPVTLFMVKLLSIHLKMQLAILTRIAIPLSPQLPVGNSRLDSTEFGWNSAENAQRRGEYTACSLAYCQMLVEPALQAAGSLLQTGD